jgi:hypothetical protein
MPTSRPAASDVAEALRTREARMAVRIAKRERLAVPVERPDLAALRQTLETRVRDWQRLLRKHPAQGAQLPGRLVEGRLTCTPTAVNGAPAYGFRGRRRSRSYRLASYPIAWRPRRDSRQRGTP